MSRWFWVRHGPTHARGFVGHSDLPADLSDEAALARLRDHLPDEALVVASDLRRASATADAIAGHRQRLPDEPDLREMNFGQWEGMDFNAISARDPELSRAFWSDPSSAAPPGGESWQELCARVDRAVAALSAAHPGRDIVVVAHMAVILSRIQQAAGISAAAALSFAIDNLSVSALEATGHGWRIQGVNHRP